MRPSNSQALTAADIATNQASAAIPASFVLQASVQAVITGSTPNGTIRLQASNDNINPLDWTTLASTSVSGSTGVYLIAKVDLCYAWVRVTWTASSGTGAITANIKMVGF